MYLINNKLIALFFLAAAFGLAIFFIYSAKIDTTALFIDSWAYKSIALNIIEHGDFSDPNQQTPNHFRAPGYPLWLALIYLIFGSFYPAVFIGIIVSAFSAPLTYLIAKELFNEKVAVLSAIFVALEPWAAFLSTSIMSEQVFLPVFLSSAYYFIRYLKDDNRRYLFWSTAILGVSALIRPNVLYFLPVLLLFAFLREQGIYRRLKYSAIAALIFLAVMMPWLLRNKIILDTWQITAVQGASLYFDKFIAFQVYLGKFKNIDEGYAKGYELIGNHTMMSKEAAGILTKEAVSGIKENLFEYIKLSVMSLPDFFTSSSYSSLGYYLGLEDFKIQSQTLSLAKTGNFSQAWGRFIGASLGEKLLLMSGALWPTTFLLFLAGIIIAFIGRRFFNSGVLFILLIVSYFDAITTLMPELARFRIQAQPFIFMFSSVSLVYVFNKAKDLINHEIF